MAASHLPECKKEHDVQYLGLQYWRLHVGTYLGLKTDGKLGFPTHAREPMFSTDRLSGVWKEYIFVKAQSVLDHMPSVAATCRSLSGLRTM